MAAAANTMRDTAPRADRRRCKNEPTQKVIYWPATSPYRQTGRRVQCLDFFAGFGGLSRGFEAARVGDKGFDVIVAANHNPYKLAVHEANHPWAEHYVADTVDADNAAAYTDPASLPPAQVVLAGIVCTHQSSACSDRVYGQDLSLFDWAEVDPEGHAEWQEKLTKSEKSRSTALCVYRYVKRHLPDVVVCECTTELTSWGKQLPGRNKVGDGSEYKRWIAQMKALGYRVKELYLNSMFFGTPQSRDRIYIVFWKETMRDPDLEHRPEAWCPRCEEMRVSRQAWKTGVPASGRVQYGKQYVYVCETCAGVVVPARPGAWEIVDWSNLGTRIGDRAANGMRPLAAATMARVERALKMMTEFPALIMPAKAAWGVDRFAYEPLGAQTSQQTNALVSALQVLAGNTFERAGSSCRTRSVDEPLWTQHATPAFGVVSAVAPLRSGRARAEPADQPLPTQLAGGGNPMVISATVPNRTHGVGRGVTEPMATQSTGGSNLLASIGVYRRGPGAYPVTDPLHTQGGHESAALFTAGITRFRNNAGTAPVGDPLTAQTAENIPMLLSAMVKNYGSIDEAKYRARPITEPWGTFTSVSTQQQMATVPLFHQKHNGGPADTAPHPFTDPLQAQTAKVNTAITTVQLDPDEVAELRSTLAKLTVDDIFLRMLGANEIGPGCGFFPTAIGGDFEVWGSERDQIDGYGNAVSPNVATWLGERLLPILDAT